VNNEVLEEQSEKWSYDAAARNGSAKSNQQKRLRRIFAMRSSRRSSHFIVIEFVSQVKHQTADCPCPIPPKEKSLHFLGFLWWIRAFSMGYGESK
jgi:hypothetical protein